jgi:hypothetical protein
MLIITAKGKKFIYKGKVSLHLGDKFIIVESEWEDPITGEVHWQGNTYDGFFIEDVESIEGVPDARKD